MTFSYAQYPYVGDDPAGVESVISDLPGVGCVLGSLAGDVEHDTQSIRASWPKGRTGPAGSCGRRPDGWGPG